MTLNNVIRGKTTVTRRGPGKIILAARTFGRRFRRDLGQSWQTGRARQCSPGSSRALLRAKGQSARPINGRFHVSRPLSRVRSYRTRRDVATSACPPAPSRPSRMPGRRKKKLNRDPVQGVAASAPRRVFVENTLQGPPMHFEAPGGLGDIASALLKHPLDVFPAHPVCRHRILGWTGQWPLRFQ